MVVLTYRARVLVTETFDSGLFGEHVINTLYDAWRRLIATDVEVCLSVCLFLSLSVCLTLLVRLFDP